MKKLLLLLMLGGCASATPYDTLYYGRTFATMGTTFYQPDKTLEECYQDLQRCIISGCGKSLWDPDKIVPQCMGMKGYQYLTSKQKLKLPLLGFVSGGQLGQRLVKGIHRAWFVVGESGFLRLEMTASQVRSILGSPNKTNRSAGAWGIHEQWVYDYRYLYFENGILTSWQD